MSVIDHVDTGFALQAVGNVQLCVVRRAVRAEDMRRVGDHYRSLLGSYPDGVMGLVVVGEGTPVAGRAALAETRAFMADLGESLQMVAVVIEGHGVAAQMLGTVVRGLNVFIRTKRMSVFTTVDGAIAALAPHIRGVGGADPSQNLRRVLGQLQQ